MKNLYFFSILLGIFYTIISCKSDDDYVPVVIKANADSAEVYQNAFIEINVLSNDSNIPNTGNLTIGNTNNATVEVVDSNNTPNNPSDDTILYTPNGVFSGNDIFQYTICSQNGNCDTGTVTVNVLPVSPVNFDLNSFPYQTLSEYNFFEGELKDLEPVYGVIPYDLNSPLFTDYAHKKRFIWMPNGSKASYNTDYTPLDFPVGSILIKSFYYDNILPDNNTKIIETRLMYVTESGWEFAKYVWNDSQTEATFTNDGSFVSFDWIDNGETKSVNYRVPSRQECFTCHNKFGSPIPIGPKPQNLNKDYTYNEGTINQLTKWKDFGYLNDSYPSDIVTTVAWDDETLPLDLRARSYVDINCAHCHSEQSYCEYRPMRFGFNTNDQLINMGVCVEPDTNVGDQYPLIMNPGDAEASVVIFRISSIEEQYRMPLLGRTLQHTEGIELIQNWINSLPDRCE